MVFFRFGSLFLTLLLLLSFTACGPRAMSVDKSLPTTGPAVMSQQINGIARIARDLSADYQKLKAEPLSADHLEKLRSDYIVLFVPGFLAEVVIDQKSIGVAIPVTRLGEYFDEQMTYLSQQGIEHRRLALESEAAVDVNGKEVIRVIDEVTQQTQKKVILITHSKGGLDTLDGLLKYPAIQGKVAAWIPVQSPFYGSPVSDWVLTNKILHPAARKLLEMLGGNIESMQGMLIEERAKYLKTWSKDIAHLQGRMRVIAYGSSKEDEKYKWDTLLEPVRDLILKKTKEPNDGLVTVKSALLPQADFIIEEGVDHAVPVMHCSLLEFDRLGHLRALLALALR